jgi:small subunit ribosomal protein S6
MKYELSLVIKPLSNEDIREKVFPKVVSTIEELGGSVGKTDFLGKRLLAYEIDSNKEGYYIFASLDLSAEGAVKLQETLNTTPELLRYMLVKEDTL